MFLFLLFLVFLVVYKCKVSGLKTVTADYLSIAQTNGIKGLCAVLIGTFTGTLLL